MSSSSGLLQLSYSFVSDPNPIRASLDGQNPNQVNLQVIISNPSVPDVVTLQGIVIQIPVGGEIGGDLSAASNLPAPAPAASGPWNLTKSGSTVSILPQSGEDGATATIVDTLIFTLNNITVNKEMGSVQLQITEVDQNGNPTTDTSHTLTKLAPDFPITSFKATPDVLYNLEESVTINWTCSSQGQQFSYRVYSIDPNSPVQPGPNSWMPKECLNNNDCYTCAAASQGVQTSVLAATTTFCLDVIQTDSSSGHRTIYQTLTTMVRLVMPSISGNSYQSLFFSGHVVMLHWLAFNAATCQVSLNENVIDNNAPADTYQKGYPVVLANPQGQNQLTVTAYAPSGPAQYPFSFPMISISQQAPIHVGGSPVRVATTPDGQHAIVLDLSGSITVIDTGTFNVAATITQDIDSEPSVTDLAITPDGRALVFDQVGIIVFDIAGRKTIGRVLTPFGTQLAIMPNGVYVLVPPVTDNNLTMVTLYEWIRVTIPLPTTDPGPWPIAITPNGALALLSNANNHVAVIDIGNQAAESQLIALPAAAPGTQTPSGNWPGPIAITPDGALALVANQYGSVVAVVDIANRRAETATISAIPGIVGMAITPDGAFALVVSNANNQVRVIDIAARRLLTTAIPAGNSPFDIAITPDGKYAFVANFDGTVAVL